MQRRIFAFTAFLFAGILLVQCTQKQESVKVDVISISIIDKETVLLNGDQVLIEGLVDKLNSFDKNVVIDIQAEDSTKMGTYQEVFKLIRIAGFSNFGASKTEMKEMANKDLK